MNQKELMLRCEINAKKYVLEVSEDTRIGLTTDTTGAPAGKITPSNLGIFLIKELFSYPEGTTQSPNTHMTLSGDAQLPNRVRVTRLDSNITVLLEKDEDPKFSTHSALKQLFFRVDYGKTIDLIIEPA